MQNVTIEPFHIIGIAIRTTNENNQAAEEIAGLWGRFLNDNILEAIPNKVDNTVYSLYTDYEGNHTQPYTAILGCSVISLDDIPQGMVGKSIDRGNYVKISAKGDLTKGLIVREWTKIWQLELNRAFTADFEVFDKNEKNPMDARVDFLVAVN
ncbi:MAG: AraC family transcriptional regulator [Roseivirga sp.]|nr:AraC family transcriptional regulator [Roseivirga sp.]